MNRNWARQAGTRISVYRYLSTDFGNEYIHNDNWRVEIGRYVQSWWLSSWGHIQPVLAVDVPSKIWNKTMTFAFECWLYECLSLTAQDFNHREKPDSAPQPRPWKKLFQGAVQITHVLCGQKLLEWMESSNLSARWCTLNWLLFCINITSCVLCSCSHTS